MEAEKRISLWLNSAIDRETHQEIETLKKSAPSELLAAFSSTLHFGTGGIREKMGVGSGRMNRYTIRVAAKGLSHFLKAHRSDQTLRVMIGYDNRLNSQLFALECARVLAADGIAVYITRELRPTPLVSFGCRHFKCAAAIMITASHNPPEYNGMKVYGSDGAQVVAPHDRAIVDEVAKLTDPFTIPLADEKDPLIHWVGEELDDAYLKAIRPLQNMANDNAKEGKNLKIIYTPLHGAGQTLTPKALRSWGFTSLSFVTPQTKPDPKFSHALKPNPEEPEAMKLGIEQLIREDADLLFANDPDADRIGITVRHQGQPVTLDGHEMAVIALYHLLSAYTFKKRLTPDYGVCTTIVTTELFHEIAKSFHVQCFECLTGFKYIGEKIREWEASVRPIHFLFGAEESQGYLVGTHARDKDGVVTLCLLAELALQLKREGLTLVDYLYDIYSRYAVYRGKTVSLTPKATLPLDKISQMMKEWRQNLPSEFFGQKVTLIEDYLTQKRFFPLEGVFEPLTLPRSDVLLFKLEDGFKIILRPSGTEPKIKLYAMHALKSAGRSIPDTIRDCDQLIAERSEKLRQKIHETLSH